MHDMSDRETPGDAALAPLRRVQAEIVRRVAPDAVARGAVPSSSTARLPHDDGVFVSQRVRVALPTGRWDRAACEAATIAVAREVLGLTGARSRDARPDTTANAAERSRLDVRDALGAVHSVTTIADDTVLQVTSFSPLLDGEVTAILTDADGRLPRLEPDPRTAALDAEELLYGSDYGY